MPQGLDLEISHHPLTMRRVVNLVVTMERLKASKSEFSCGTEFRDEDLLNMIVESAIEGKQTWEHGAHTHAKPQGCGLFMSTFMKADL